MRYKMFLYKNDSVSEKSFPISWINEAVKCNTINEWNHNKVDTYMQRFDAEQIVEKIKSEFSFGGNTMGYATVCHSPENKAEYICVVTSYENARKVLAIALRIAVENELVLFDAEMNKTFLINGIYDQRWVSMRLRAQKLNELIRKTQEPIWKIRALYKANLNFSKDCAYTLTLKKDPNASLEQRVQKFYALLKANLVEGEALSTDFRCFKICGNGYNITYCVEAYKKNADRICFIDDGIAKTELMYRMGCEKAFKQLGEMHINNKTYIDNRMILLEWVKKYPNPAERFSELIKYTKKLNKLKFDISLGGIGFYGSQILFHVVPSEFYADDRSTISVLKIEEESATYILPIIETVYPYIYERYYLTPNHIPKEMMIDIVKHIKFVKKLLLTDIHNEVIKTLTNQFNLYVLSNEEDEKTIKENRLNFVNQHRYEIANFYDMFVEWVEDQLLFYYDDDLMFNIQGP